MEWLSILGISVSVVGVILSLMLFNASINNGRKILLNNILYDITYELFFMFSKFNGDESRVKDVHKFNRAFIKIGTQLNQIKYDSKIGVPLLGWSTSYDNEVATQKFGVVKEYNNMLEYFNKRKIYGIDILMEYFDDRMYFIQSFSQKRKYIRRFFVGPIIGIRVYAVRNKKTIAFNKNMVHEIPIRKVKSQNGLKKYYDEVHMKFSPIIRQQTVPFERNDMDIVTKVKKGKELPLTIYR